MAELHWLKKDNTKIKILEAAGMEPKTLLVDGRGSY